MFSFSLSSSSVGSGPQGSFECVQQCGSRSLESLGPMTLKMNVKAKEDVYEATRQRMAVAEEESKKNWYIHPSSFLFLSLSLLSSLLFSSNTEIPFSEYTFYLVVCASVCPFFIPFHWLFHSTLFSLSFSLSPFFFHFFFVVVLSSSSSPLLLLLLLSLISLQYLIALDNNPREHKLQPQGL